MRGTSALDEVRAAATEVLSTGDPETAHCLEDELYVTVLRAVVAGHPQAWEMAAEALRVSSSTHERWYA